MFSGCAVPPYSKETKLGSSHQEASPSADKNTRVVLVPYSRMEVHPYSCFWWCCYLLLKQVIDSHQFKPTDAFTGNHIYNTNATKNTEQF